MTESCIRRKVDMGRYWNRLVRLSDDRLTKKSISMGFRSEIEGLGIRNEGDF